MLSFNGKAEIISFKFGFNFKIYKDSMILNSDVSLAESTIEKS